VEEGDVLANMYTSEEDRFESAERLFNEALAIYDTKPELKPLIIKEIVHQ